MKICIIRHGQSEFNKQMEIDGKALKFCGAEDFPLTDEGRKQAEKLKDNLELKQVEKIYASDLSRAIETAKIAIPDKEIIIDKRIRERSLGFFENQYVDEMREKYPELFDEKGLISDFKVRAPEGENYLDISKRLKSFFNEMNLQEDTSIALFSHFHCIKTILYVLLGLDEKEMKKAVVKNCDLVILEGKELGKFKILSHKYEALFRK